jgi:hypothetical protein
VEPISLHNNFGIMAEGEAKELNESFSVTTQAIGLIITNYNENGHLTKGTAMIGPTGSSGLSRQAS